MATNPNPNPQPVECDGTWREVVILTPAFVDWQLLKCSGCGELWAIHHGGFPQFQVKFAPGMDVTSALIHADLDFTVSVAS